MSGEQRLVDIGVGPVPDAAMMLRRPRLSAPAADAHKYRRGFVAVVGGAMPGAALLACKAAQRAGAGYVKLLAEPMAVPADLVIDSAPLAKAVADERIGALLIGPGLGRDAAARGRLAAVLQASAPAVLDADALLLLQVPPGSPAIATPHEAEFNQLEKTFNCKDDQPKPLRAKALAQASGMVIVAKGPDTVVAAPDGRLACAPGASSWLSVAGTGDVLAGTIASRLATGAPPFTAACEGVWLHGEAARLAGPAFTAGTLADRISAALETCL